jgi:ribosomal protein S18 acetylase RimI-like enzyme
MPQPSFRHARQSDTPALVALIERAYRGEDMAGRWNSEAHLLKGPRTNEDEITTLISRGDSRFLVAELDGRIVGCCLMQGLSDPARNWSSADGPADPGLASSSIGDVDAAYFGMFAIDPAIHGGGLGKQIIAEAERRVRDLWDARQMVMTVINLRTELIGWYERRGYHLTGATLPFPFSETTGETTRDFHLAEMRKHLR